MTERKLSGFEILLSLLLQALVVWPISLLLTPQGRKASFPLCLKHRLRYGFPGKLLPVLVFVQLLLVLTCILLLAVLGNVAWGLLLAGVSVLFLFAITTAYHYAPKVGLPVLIQVSDESYIYQIDESSHFHGDERI